MNKENILFQLYFDCNFWNTPPHLKILIDDTVKYNNELDHGECCIKFDHVCSFDQPHRLTVVRTGKNNNQRKVDSDGTVQDQIVNLQKIVIDGIDIQNIIWSKSVYVPEYPEPWASQQLAASQTLEQQVKGCTTFGHNGIWYLDFTSPFYIFLMKWMGGGIYDEI